MLSCLYIHLLFCASFPKESESFLDHEVVLAHSSYSLVAAERQILHFPQQLHLHDKKGPGLPYKSIAMGFGLKGGISNFVYLCW